MPQPGSNKPSKDDLKKRRERLIENYTDAIWRHVEAKHKGDESVDHDEEISRMYKKVKDNLDTKALEQVKASIQFRKDHWLK